MNHRSNFVLSASMTVVIMTLTAGSASAAGHGKMASENVGTRAQGISVKPKPTIDPTKIVGFKIQPRPQGIMIPPKPTGLKPTGLIPIPYQNDLAIYGNEVIDLTRFGMRLMWSAASSSLSLTSAMDLRA
jgi:hypothetical protein